jgi:hypothetical protein
MSVRRFPGQAEPWFPRPSAGQLAFTSAGQVTEVPVQVSAASQVAADARQTVLLDWNASAGHAEDVPGQFSAASQTSAWARQTVLAGEKASVGQAADDPVQLSATSHTSAAGLHVVPLALSPLGQVVDVPVQTVVVSQTPAEVWHVTPALPAGCWHVAVAPSHWSKVQGFGSEVHAVPLAFKPLGQVVELPVHVAAESHSPPEAWHAAPEFPAGC